MQGTKDRGGREREREGVEGGERRGREGAEREEGEKESINVLCR
jgi:hypothetical protein